jgi:hypothetical protein
MVQLEPLQYIVSTRVHVADVLVSESCWLEGSWIIQGDALIGVDMSKAEIRDRNEQTRTAAIVLPQPTVISARANHEKSQQWDIKSRSWIPLASLLLGDRTAMERQAMLVRQRLVEHAALVQRIQSDGPSRRGAHADRVLRGHRLAGLSAVEVMCGTGHGNAQSPRVDSQAATSQESVEERRQRRQSSWVVASICCVEGGRNRPDHAERAARQEGV